MNFAVAMKLKQATASKGQYVISHMLLSPKEVKTTLFLTERDRMLDSEM
jgi:hypothetical protein